jgi:hypothetical protein
MVGFNGGCMNAFVTPSNRSSCSGLGACWIAYGFLRLVIAVCLVRASGIPLRVPIESCLTEGVQSASQLGNNLGTNTAENRTKPCYMT